VPTTNYEEIVTLTWQAEQPIAKASEILSRLEQINQLLGVSIPESVSRLGGVLTPVATALAGMARDAQTFADAMGRASHYAPPPPTPGFGGGAPAPAARTVAGFATPEERLAAYVAREDPAAYVARENPALVARLRSVISGGVPEQDPFEAIRAQARAQQQAVFQYEAFRASYIPPVVSQQQMLQALGEAEYMSQAQYRPLADPGRGAPNLRRVFLEEQLEGAQIRQAAALRDVRAEVEGAAGRYEQASRQVQAYRRAIEDADGGLHGFERTIVRHISALAIMIAAYEAVRVVGQVIREIAQEFIQLEAVSARVGFITGQAPGVAQAQVFAQTLAGARYGIPPSEAQQVALLAAQTRATQQQQEEARQIAFVFGVKEYGNALLELIQTQKIADAAGLEHVNVLGYLATAYSDVPGTLEEYFDALQAGMTVYKDIGVGAEQAGLVVAKVAQAMESGATQAANTIQTIINRLRKPETQEALLAFGVTGQNIPELLRNSTAALQNLVQTGQDQRAQELIYLLAGGTINVQRIREAPLVFLELSNAIDQSGESLANFDRLVTDVGDTTQKSIEQLTASWGLFLEALGQTATVTGAFEGLNTFLQGLTSMLKILPDLQASGLWAMPPEQRQQYLQAFEKRTGAQAFTLFGTTFAIPSPQQLELGRGIAGGEFNLLNLLSPVWWTGGGLHRFVLGKVLGGLGALLGVNQALYAGAAPFLAEGGQPQSRQDLVGGGGGPVGPAGPMPWTGPWGIRDLPEGTTFDRLRSATEKWDALLTQLIPEYQQKYAVDPSTGQRKDLTLTYFRDPITNSFEGLKTTNEALRLALEELTKIERAKITGAFNVPAGGEALISFYAAQAGFVPQAGAFPPRGYGDRPYNRVFGEGPLAGVEAGWVGVSRIGSSAAQMAGLLAQLAGTDSEAPARPSPSLLATRPYNRASGRSRFSNLYEKAEMDVRRPATATGSGGFVINNRITVMIDGQVVFQTLNRQMHRQNYGNSNVGGNPSSLLVE
jgi:hypothetical protein